MLFFLSFHSPHVAAIMKIYMSKFSSNRDDFQALKMSLALYREQTEKLILTHFHTSRFLSAFSLSIFPATVAVQFVNGWSCQRNNSEY